MVRNALQRLLQSVLVLLGAALLVFLMLRIIPGNPAAVLMGEHADATVIKRMTEELGLDQPVLVQFFRYIADALRVNLPTPVTRLQKWILDAAHQVTSNSIGYNYFARGLVSFCRIIIPPSATN